MAKQKTDIESLFDAIHWGAISRADKIIKATPNLHKQDKDGNTALISALKKGQFKIAEKIIEKMDKIYQQDNNGDTALIIAIKIGQIDLAEKMVNKMDRVDQENNYQNTAFGYAELNHHDNLVQLINTKQAQHDASITMEDKILSSIFSQLSKSNATDVANSLKELAKLIENGFPENNKNTVQTNKKSLTSFKGIFTQTRKG